MHEIERNRSQKLGCQANGGACAGHAPLDPPMIRLFEPTTSSVRDLDVYHRASKTGNRRDL